MLVTMPEEMQKPVSRSRTTLADDEGTEGEGTGGERTEDKGTECWGAVGCCWVVSLAGGPAWLGEVGEVSGLARRRWLVVM